MKTCLRSIGALSLTLVLCACGGGSGGSAPATVKPASSGQVAITLQFPSNIHYAKKAASATSTKRPPAYLNPTPGAVISITDNDVTAQDILVNPNSQGAQTVEVPVVGGQGGGATNGVTVSEYSDSNHDLLLAQGSTTFYYTAGTDQGFTLNMLMYATGAAFTNNATSQGGVLSTDSGSPTPEYFCSTGTPFFVYATDSTYGFVSSAYPGVPQVLLGSQTYVSGSAVVTQLPGGGFLFNWQNNNDTTNVTFYYQDPLYGDTVNTYVSLIGQDC